MHTYTTQYALHLSTKAPFVHEVPQDRLDVFAKQEVLIREGKARGLGSIEDLTRFKEFTFFSTYHDLLKIGFEDGFTPDLLTKILKEFGVDEPHLQKLLEDKKFLSEVKPWFEGITWDGEKAGRTLKIVYERAVAALL